MRCVLLILLIFAFGDSEWHATDLGIYHPIKAHDIAVDFNNSLYVVDSERDRIVGIHDDGSITSIGRSGHGPGEFSRLGRIYHDGENLYATNIFPRKISIFSNGNHKKTLTPDRSIVRLVPYRKGWLFVQRRAQENKVALVSSSLDFSNRHTIHVWSERTKEKTEFRSDNTVKMNPAEPMEFLGVNQNATIGYFTTHDDPNLYIVESPKKTVLLSIKNRVPFSEEWGRKRIKEIEQEANTGEGPLMKISPLFPEYFPFFKDIIAGPDDLLWIMNGQHYFDAKAKPIIASMRKGILDSDYAAKFNPARIIHLFRDWAYITTFDNESGAFGIAKVKQEKMFAFLKAHPIPPK